MRPRPADHICGSEPPYEAAGICRLVKQMKGDNNPKMRSDRYQEDKEELNEGFNEAAADVEEYLEPEGTITEESTSTQAEPKKNATRAEKKAAKKAAKEKDLQGEPDLTKMKKHDLLEIMLAQSREIDRLRERVSELESQLANREFEFSKIGSIAEASLAVTNIFKEAEKAAVIYIENIRRRCEKEE